MNDYGFFVAGLFVAGGVVPPVAGAVWTGVAGASPGTACDGEAFVAGAAFDGEVTGAGANV
jgi:hypothetical protein